MESVCLLSSLFTVHRPPSTELGPGVGGPYQSALAVLEEPGGIERRRDGLELVAEEPDDQLVDQAGLLDLRGVAAAGDDDLAGTEEAVGGADRAGDVGDDPVVGAPDEQARVGDPVER